MPWGGVGGWERGAGNPEAGSDSSISATPFTYQQSKRGGAVHSNWDPFPQQVIQVLCKAQAKFIYEREYFWNRLKANLARNPTVPFDLRKDLLPELWQIPETAVDNKNLPIRLEHLCGDGEWVSALKEAQEIPLAVLECMKDVAFNAFFSIQPNGPFQPYSKIKQLPSEPFVTFVERLIRAIELRVKNEGSQEQVLEEMVLTNANEHCKAAILSLP
ncbi:hypothetical protein DUI87_29930 [Hirundo rustica rustica]|uniref:Retroviral nucleocapsid Gag protein p24 C-terminal domain-containing protein n=1 Tax=Hirundo rustica rustica TaxID=333673 RepID=A0A3M0J091_HIRRU|nr:hypothetical protein DUI87_29930 [Hirundo rustica rustica]